MHDAPHAITSLTLENFRNYNSLTLELAPRPVILRGVNGAGKTNILEAISLLSPGRGFRGAKLRDMDRQVAPVGEFDAFSVAPPMPWVVAAEVRGRGDILHVGTGRDPESSIEKRITKINGQKVRGASCTCGTCGGAVVDAFDGSGVCGRWHRAAEAA